MPQADKDAATPKNHADSYPRMAQASKKKTEFVSSTSKWSIWGAAALPFLTATLVFVGTGMMRGTASSENKDDDNDK